MTDRFLKVVYSKQIRAAVKANKASKPAVTEGRAE
jgi:hypothetical protein